MFKKDDVITWQATDGFFASAVFTGTVIKHTAAMLRVKCTAAKNVPGGNADVIDRVHQMTAHQVSNKFINKVK